MNTAHELFWKSMDILKTNLTDKEAFNLLMLASSLWEGDEQYFYAGCAMSNAARIVGIEEENEKICLISALENYHKCIDAAPTSSLEGLAALIKLGNELHNFSWRLQDKTKIRCMADELYEELGHRLMAHYAESPKIENYLVKGVILKTDFQGNWEPLFPDYEVQWGVERYSKQVMKFNLPSAFHIFVNLCDYQGGEKIIELCPDAFISPGLRGWKAAVRGFSNPELAPEMFEEAGNAFLEDTMPDDGDLPQRGGLWSSVNIDLWGKYFLSRSALAKAVQDSSRLNEHIKDAANIVQEAQGWHDANVSRYKILLQTLAQLVGEDPGLEPEQAKQQFIREIGFTGGKTEDNITMKFLELASEAFEGFNTNPQLELTSGRLSNALKALERISLIGPDISSAITPAIGNNMWELALGPVNTWIYRSLESIGGRKGEDKLRKIILRLVQSYLPLYAQIIHGPIEYGRDIIVLLKSNDHLELHMFQVKCGNMTIPDWRTSRNQLEEMFQTSLPNSIIPDNLHPQRIGILAYNGHPNLQVAPLMDGWLEEQKRDHGREYKFMHLDDIVQCISRERLVNEFRKAFSELDNCA